MSLLCITYMLKANKQKYKKCKFQENKQSLSLKDAFSRILLKEINLRAYNIFDITLNLPSSYRYTGIGRQ